MTALAALLAAAAMCGGCHEPPATPVRAACQEDAPCWTWSTMGNHRRGIVTIDGRRLIVNRYTFRTLDAIGVVDWRRTRHLRGDWTARHG